MTKAGLEKEAREYLAEHTKYSEIFGEFFVAVDTLTAMVDFAEPREKQIQIDAEQIRALQKQNGELTDELMLTNNECKEMREELKQRIRENQKLCEQIEKGKVVEHFEAYGQCRDSRRIAELEMTVGTLRNFSNEQATCIEKLEAQIEKMKCCGNCAFQLVIGGVRDSHCVKCNACSEWKLED